MRIVLLAVLLAATAAFAEDALRVRVTGIADGDTIYVRDPRGRNAMVWIEGIDAPEPRQAYGARAKYSLRNLVSMRTVMVVPRSIDAYGRIVGRVYLGDLDIGLEQVRRGMAWYDDSADLDDGRAYEEAQANARRDNLGLWHGNPVPP
ncbi:MAG TPA: thermonuclease family protein, partial [Thermoanaerobaculia bacterium]|nr:thermonuclease family protein [Thermoanaerobaculia bacterium]